MPSLTREKKEKGAYQEKTGFQASRDAQAVPALLALPGPGVPMEYKGIEAFLDLKVLQVPKAIEENLDMF